MKTLIFALFLTVSTSLRLQAQATLGSVTYELSTTGRVIPISDTTGVVQNTDLFYAELWAAKAPANETSLQAVPFSLISWKFGNRLLGAPVKKLDIPGTEGGDTGTIQLRVWKATVTDWQSAVSQNLPRGSSPLASIKLGGSSADGTLTFPLPVGPFIEGFSIIPEPSALAFVYIGAGMFLLGRKNRRSLGRRAAVSGRVSE